MGKLLTGAILGGLGQAYFGFQKWNDENKRTQELFARQDKQAKEVAATRKQEIKEARWAKGIFGPGEEEMAFPFDDFQADRARRQELRNPKPEVVDLTTFAPNGGQPLMGPKNMPKAKAMDLSTIAVSERPAARDNATIAYAAEFYSRMKAQNNQLSDPEIWDILERNNQDFSDDIKAMVRDRYDNATIGLQERATKMKGESLSYMINPETLFRNTRFSNLIKAPLLQHIGNSTSGAHKELVASWKISEGSATTAGRAMGSVAAHIKGGRVRPGVQKLFNDRFVNLNTKMLEDDTFTYAEWQAEMRQQMGGNPTDQQMLDAFVDASTLKQPYAVVRSLAGGLTIGDINPIFTPVENATARAKLHEQSASQLVTATRSIAEVGSRANVEVTAAGENVRRKVSETVNKWVEGFRSLFGMNLDQDRTLHALDVDITDPNKSTDIRNNAFSDMESTLRQLVADGRISQGTATNQLAKLREFKKGMEGNVDDETYLFNFQRVKLAYLYAKFIQGGGGGNAVSDADFQRNFDALFGQYSTIRDVVLADMLKGIGAIHNDGQRALEDAQVRKRHSYLLQGKQRTTLSPASVQLYRKKHRATQDLLDQAGYQGVAQYWINTLHGGDVSQASPLLRAMLRSSGRKDLQMNVADERGVPRPPGLFSEAGDSDELVSSGTPVAQRPDFVGTPAPAQTTTGNTLLDEVFN